MKSVTKKGLLVLVFAVIITGGAFAQVPGFAVGARLIGILPLFKPGFGSESTPGFGFGLAAQASYNFTELLGVQAEVIFNGDEVSERRNGAKVTTISEKSLLLPVLVRVGSTFENGMELTGTAGFYYTIPLGEAKVSPAQGSATKDSWNGGVGAMLGGILGFPFGPGVIVGDIRVAFDFYETQYKYGGQIKETLTKRAFHFGVGYSIPLNS